MKLRVCARCNLIVPAAIVECQQCSTVLTRVFAYRVQTVNPAETALCFIAEQETVLRGFITQKLQRSASSIRTAAILQDFIERGWIVPVDYNGKYQRFRITAVGMIVAMGIVRRESRRFRNAVHGWMQQLRIDPPPEPDPVFMAPPPGLSPEEPEPAPAPKPEPKTPAVIFRDANVEAMVTPSDFDSILKKAGQVRQ